MNRAVSRVSAVAVVALGLLGGYVMLTRAPVAPQSTVPTASTAPAATPSRAVAEPPAAVVNATEPVASGPRANTAAPEDTTPPALTELPRYNGPVRDATTAAAIREALIARKAVELGNGQMPKPVGAGNQAGKPLGQYVERTMREQFMPLAGECYSALLESHPNVAGNVMLEFSVVGDPAVGGVVVDVNLGPETTLTNPEFRTCMSESMYAIVFDAPPGKDGTVTVKQSFELAP